MAAPGKTVKAIPAGYEGALPYLMCEGAAQAIEFYKKAFGAIETVRMNGPNGTVGHAELRIAGALIMLADVVPGTMAARGPKALGGTPVSIYIYVEDVDAFAKRAMEAGIKVLRPVTDQFYGDRSVSFEDPFGHLWGFATHIEDVTPEEMKKRMGNMAK